MIANRSTNIIRIVDITASLKFKYRSRENRAKIKQRVSNFVIFFSQYMIHNQNATRHQKNSTKVTYEPYPHPDCI